MDGIYPNSSFCFIKRDFGTEDPHPERVNKVDRFILLARIAIHDLCQNAGQLWRYDAYNMGLGIVGTVLTGVIHGDAALYVDLFFGKPER